MIEAFPPTHEDEAGAGPSTAFFAGYGSSLDEPRSFQFSRLERVNDGFFIKASYLWSM